MSLGPRSHPGGGLAYTLVRKERPRTESRLGGLSQSVTDAYPSEYAPRDKTAPAYLRAQTVSIRPTAVPTDPQSHTLRSD
jgi:hypothetical protein